MNPRYRATARRHRVLFALIILLCAFLGLAQALGAPKLYRSNATLYFRSLDSGAAQFGATPPPAQNQVLLNELLATRSFPQTIAAKSDLGAYLQHHSSMGGGPITLLKQALKGSPTQDERIAAALSAKRVTSVAGNDLLGVSFAAPTPALAQSTLTELLHLFLQERSRLQGNALKSAMGEFSAARTQLTKAQVVVESYAHANPGSANNGDPELRALTDAQVQATRQLRAAATTLNTALLAIGGGSGLSTIAGVFEKPNQPVGPTTGKKRVGELTIVGAFLGALISFGLIALMSRRTREEPPAPSRPADLPEHSPNGNSGSTEHEPVHEVLVGERSSEQPPE